MKYPLEFLHFICCVLLILIGIQVRKIYSYIYSVFLKILNFIIFLLKIIIFNFIKLILISIIFFTVLVVVTIFAEFMIVFFMNFIIGLRESFISSTRLGKLYLINLYIILAYMLIMREEISEKIYKYIEGFKNKYFHSKNKRDVEKYRNVILFLFVYVSICFVGISFYQWNGNEWSEKNKGDIINIFIWATYLIAPIVAVWVYSDWREPHKLNKKIDLTHEVEDQILNLEVAARNLDKLTQDYIDKKITNYYELQFNRNEFTRKTANLNILSRRLELTPELKALSQDVNSLNYYFVNYSFFSRDFIDILKNKEVKSWSSYENSFGKDEKLKNLFINYDNREEHLSSCYGKIYEIQKDLIKIMDDYSFKQ